MHQIFQVGQREGAGEGGGYHYAIHSLTFKKGVSKKLLDAALLSDL